MGGRARRLAIAADGPVTGIDPEYALLCQADEMYGEHHTLTDATLTRLLDTFGPGTTRKYIATVAWFSLLSLFLNAPHRAGHHTDRALLRQHRPADVAS